MSDEIEGSLVVSFLRRCSPKVGSELLKGCTLWDDEREQELTIVRVEPFDAEIGDRLLCLRESDHRMIHFNKAKKMAFVVPPEQEALRLALFDSKNLQDQNKENAILLLRKMRFPISLIEGNMDDLNLLVSGIALTENELIPPITERYALYKIFDKYRESGFAIPALRLVLKWANHQRKTSLPSADIQIRLAFLLRHTGQPELALVETDAVKSSNYFNGSTHEFSILCTQRAAILLDIFQTKHDPNLLDEARRFADKSWSIEASGECSLVYNRLRALESQRT